jgi:hypothetical protein
MYLLQITSEVAAIRKDTESIIDHLVDPEVSA